MFQLPAALQPTFQPEAILTPLQNDCYKARAQALRSRFPWSSALTPVWHATLIHLSANVPGKVAYFASVDNMVNNRLTRTSPEMFLQRTLQYAPEEIKMAWSVEVLGQTLPEVSFMENDNAEGWYHVYDNGPRSCMRGADECKQYAHPKNHLALAYHQNVDGEITQRTIVNKQKMTYIRIYGSDDINFFVAALNKLGYSQSDDTLQGETIWVNWRSCCNCDRDVLAGPYLDGSGGYLLIDPNNPKEGVIGERGQEMMFSDDELNCGNCGDNDDDDRY